jgi:isoquinoline 1-oxidoreductase subunit beta
MATIIDRRHFLASSVALGGGMALGISPAGAVEAVAVNPAAPWAGAVQGATELHPWIAILPDDTVMVRVPTPEVGNGASTQVAMNVAEELGCDWAKVKIEFASVRRDYLERGVYTSGLQPMFSGHGTDHNRMRHALQLGANARQRLKQAAAGRWGAWPEDIDVKDSVLTHRPTGRTLRFGEVAADAVNVRLDTEPQLKTEEEWTFLGKKTPHKINAAQIADGSIVYGIDVRLPGMVYAALKQCPVHGGKLKSHDPQAVLGMPGVRAVVVIDPAKSPGSPVPNPLGPALFITQAQHGVAVIADHYWQAKTALDALPVEWDLGPGARFADSQAMYAEAGRALDADKGKVHRARGDVASVKKGRKVEATYLTPYCDNAAMEPLNGTALVTKDKVELWHPAQDQQQAFWVTVDESGLKPDQVDVHQTYIGGAFGRRTMSDDVRMVVAVARQYPGVPVHVIWSREETTRQGRYRTFVNSRFAATLGEDGLPQSWTAHAALGGMPLLFGFDDTPYVVSGIVPNSQVSVSNLPFHLLTGAYRGPGYNSHSFMVETFIDECAVAAKADPVEYRLRMLSKWDEAWSKVLTVAAEKAGWGSRRLPKGEGMGVAIANWPNCGTRLTGTTVAAVVRAAVGKDGVLSVKQVDVAFDCGRTANRDAVAAQIEGAVIFGLNFTINEEITVRNGEVIEGNYDDYPMLRMGDVPPVINVHFDALSGHERFQPVGEAPVGPVSAALGNAIFAATGKRLRSTPFRKADLKWA